MCKVGGRGVGKPAIALDEIDMEGDPSTGMLVGVGLITPAAESVETTVKYRPD